MGISFGTCTWNYPSWQGLIYSKKHRYAHEYLTEYQNYSKTAEIDSWFYKMPSFTEAQKYSDSVGHDFRFTAKVFNHLSLTHFSDYKNRTSPPIINPNFLSSELFDIFLKSIEPLIPKLAGLILEFEYLNTQKMPSVPVFLDKLSNFLKENAKKVPLCIETRNKNYITTPYFQVLRSFGVGHVLNEKEFMPSIESVYGNYSEYFGEDMIIRLLGGNRAEIEAMTKDSWHEIVIPKESKAVIRDLLKTLMLHKKEVIVNVNNHFEGSSPKTIDWFRKELGVENDLRIMPSPSLF